MNISLKRIPALLPGVLLLGAVSQIGQVLFLRELLMVFYGSELSIGIILAAWLVWVGVGSRLGAAIIDKLREPRRAIVFTSMGIALSIPASILLMRGSRALFDVLPGAYLSLWDMTRASFLLMAPTCLLLGMQFVLLVRIWRERDRQYDTSTAAKTYLTEAAGNILGGLAFTFLLVRSLSVMQTALVLVILISAAILPMIWPVTRERSVLCWAVFSLLLLAIVLFPFADQLDAWAYRQQWAHFSPQHQLIETHPSQYGTISILERKEQYSFFQSGHLVFSTAGPDATDAGMENIDAVQFAHFAMVQHEQPRRVLLIGGGMRGILEEILRHPIQHVDYIELDEVLTETVRPYLPFGTRQALNHPRVRLLHTDGRLFVKTTEQTYDLIILDLPDPATAVLNRFYTVEFFQEVNALLEPGGVFIIGAATTPDMRGLAIANRNTTLFHSLSSEFSLVQAIPDQMLVFVATNQPETISLDPALLAQRYQARAIQSDAFAPEYFDTMLQDVDIRRVGWILRTHGRDTNAHRDGPGTVPLTIPSLNEQEQRAAELPPVNQRFFNNSDLKPIGYYYTVMFLEHLTRAGQTETLAGLLNVKPWWLVSILTLPVLVLFGLKLANRGEKQTTRARLAILFSVFTTGFSMMMLQVSLIFAFQSVYGFIYEIIGIITALFMCGLAAGTFLSHRSFKEKSNLNLLMKIQFLMSAYGVLMAISFPAIIRIHSPALIITLFSSLLFLAGLLNGLNFPIAAACTLNLSKQADKSAGLVYSGELFGACAGSVLASVLIAPMWGIIASCLIASAASISAMLTLSLSRRT
jgi:spermidine synthase